MTAQSFFNPPSEAGIADAFLTFRLPNLLTEIPLRDQRRSLLEPIRNHGRVRSRTVRDTCHRPDQRRRREHHRAIRARAGLPPGHGAGHPGAARQSTRRASCRPGGTASPTRASGAASRITSTSGSGTRASRPSASITSTAWTQDDRASQGTTPDGSIRRPRRGSSALDRATSGTSISRLLGRTRQQLGLRRGHHPGAQHHRRSRA